MVDGVIHSIKEKIEKEELIKVKFSQNKEDKISLSKELIKKTESKEVCLIGHTLILYKKSKNPKNRHIKIYNKTNSHTAADKKTFKSHF